MQPVLQILLPGPGLGCFTCLPSQSLPQSLHTCLALVTVRGGREGGREGERERESVRRRGTVIKTCVPYHSTLRESHSHSFLRSWNNTLSLSFLTSSASHCMALISSSRSSLDVQTHKITEFMPEYTHRASLYCISALLCIQYSCLYNWYYLKENELLTHDLKI